MEKAGKNNRRFPCCTFCKERVKNHDGPCGRLCKKRPLISFHEEQEPELDTVELEVDIDSQDSEDSQESRPEMSSETNAQNVPIQNEHIVNSNAISSAGAGPSVASTPRPPADVPTNSAGQADGSDIIYRLSQQLDRLETRFNALDRRLQQDSAEREEGRSFLRSAIQQPSASASLHSTPASYRRPLELAEEPAGTVALPAPPRQIPGLRPVPDNIDLSNLPVIDGLSDKDIKDALRGEFLYIDVFLGTGYSPIEENKLETKITDGQVEYKVKTFRRKVTDLTSWLEGWFIYEKLLTLYHGIEVYKIINEYRELITDLSKQHPWPAVYVWDIKNRHRISGKSIAFNEFEPTKFATHFIAACSRQDGNICKLCYSHDHPTDICPYRDAPGLADKLYDNRETCFNYNYKVCRYRRCNKAHVCKVCRGPLPHSECQYYGPCGRRNRHR